MDEQAQMEATKVGKVAFNLFAFMQRSRLNCNFTPHPNKILTYQFVVNDMTDGGTPFGLSFEISPTELSEVQDTPESIEEFCFGLTVKMGTALFTEKVTRLLQYAEEPQKSRIILPGQ